MQPPNPATPAAPRLVENDARQSSIAQNKLQAQSPRHLDLQRQVSELKVEGIECEFERIVQLQLNFSAI
jgi:hypothetical protein